MSKPVYTVKFLRNSDDENAQIYSIIAFAVILFVIGIPLWWKTTEISRPDLPYEEIKALSDKELLYHITVTLILTDESTDYDVIQTFEASLNNTASSKLVGRGIWNWTVRYMFEAERQVFKSSKAPTDILEKIHDTEIYEEPGSLNIFILPPNSSVLNDPTTFYIGRHRNILYKIGTDIFISIAKLQDLIVNSIVKNGDLTAKALSISSSDMLQQNFALLNTPKFSPAYDVVFTVVNPSSSVVETSWEIEKAIEKYFEIMVQKLAFYAEFNLKSQVLLLTSFNIQTYFDAANYCHYLKLEELSQLTNSLESRLGVYASRNPTLNFVVYIPSGDQLPLLIYDHNGKPTKHNSFIIPQWGGVLFYNTSSISDKPKFSLSLSLDMKEIMKIFIEQFRLLLGVSFNLENFQTKVASFDESNLMNWELDYLMRIHSFENLLTAINTLQSLAKLLREIKYIVINKEVEQLICHSLESVKNGFLALKNRNLSEAFLLSKQGYVLAEKAFFNPSLLAQMYFPDHEKYAIYTPLLVPLSIPVFSSLFVLLQILKN